MQLFNNMDNMANFIPKKLNNSPQWRSLMRWFPDSRLVESNHFSATWVGFRLTFQSRAKIRAKLSPDSYHHIPECHHDDSFLSKIENMYNKTSNFQTRTSVENTTHESRIFKSGLEVFGCFDEIHFVFVVVKYNVSRCILRPARQSFFNSDIESNNSSELVV